MYITNVLSVISKYISKSVDQPWARGAGAACRGRLQARRRRAPARGAPALAPCLSDTRAQARSRARARRTRAQSPWSRPAPARSPQLRPCAWRGVRSRPRSRAGGGPTWASNSPLRAGTHPIAMTACALGARGCAPSRLRAPVRNLQVFKS